MAAQTYSSDKRALQCGCPRKQEDYKSQGCSINNRDKGAEGQGRLVVSTGVT